MKTVMVVLDGIQDVAYPELGGKTPYEAGRGDTFLRVESESATGLLRATPIGMEADTQTCVLTLLGLPADAIPPGRSYIEALAQGIEVGEDDIIMRCNFVEVDGEGRLAVPCCNAPVPVAAELRKAVTRQPGHFVVPVGGYKSLQRISGGRKYIDTLVTFTPHQHQHERFEELLPRGNELADALAQFSRDRLREYSPYTVLNWGAAVREELPTFSKLHSGLAGAMISKTDAPIGIAAAMDMSCPELPTATGDTDTDLALKVRETLGHLETHDFVLLHIGGPDEATHRQDPAEKAAFIRRLDSETILPLLEGLPQGARMMLTSDHEALCKTAGHTGAPVQFWLWEKGKALSGDFGEQPGTRAMEILFGK